ncbi:MAG: hypothetical protein U9R29_10115 [Thermodesulfobacteriota bacterium]|nr:hypothetical protein [Thermodesulfobacteriota bacterium]
MQRLIRTSKLRDNYDWFCNGAAVGEFLRRHLLWQVFLLKQSRDFP